MSLCLALPGTAIMFHAADNSSPAFLSTVMSAATLPWCVKSVFGAISDAHPIAGMHRAPYIMAHAFGFTLCWYALGSSGVLHHSFAFAGLIFAQSWCMVWIDVMLDATMCDLVQKERARYGNGKLQSGVWLSRSSANLVGSIAGALLLNCISAQSVFKLTGVCATPIAAVAFKLEPVNLDEEDSAPPQTVAQVMRRTLALFHREDVLRRSSLFLGLCASMPSCGLAFVYYLRNHLRYTPNEFAVLDCAGDAAHVVGAALFRSTLRQGSVRSLATRALFFVAALRLLQLIIVTGASRSLLLASAEEIGLAVGGQVLMMPILTLSADNISDDTCTATAYSVVLGCANLGGMLSVMLGGMIAQLCGVSRTSFKYLWIAILLTAVLGAAPVLTVQKLLPAYIQAQTACPPGTADSTNDRRKTSGRRTWREIVACSKAVFAQASSDLSPDKSGTSPARSPTPAAVCPADAEPPRDRAASEAERQTADPSPPRDDAAAVPVVQ